MKLNEKIVFYRKRMGLSQEAMAEKLGVSRQAVSKWELGDASPELEKLIALSELFGVSIDSLVKEEGETEKRRETKPFEETLFPRRSRQNPMEMLVGLIKRYGYLAGFILSAYGLGVLGIGALARFGFKSILDPFGSMQFSSMNSAFRFPLVFAGIIMGIGALMILGGLILAFVLKRRGKQKTDN